jgi:solute carrier family 25 (mitochondrial phosphate transporter), member 23/24/25/41
MALEQHDIQQQQSGREAFDSSLAGAQERPWLPRLRSDPSFYRPLPHNLLEFRQQEGPKERERHLRDLWRRLPKSVGPLLDHETLSGAEEDAFISGDGKDDKELTHKRAQKLKQEYESELMGRCHGSARGHIGWREFRAYADAKEVGAYRSHSFYIESFS